ncbi:MAG: hypothetical protein JWO48_3858 [Bryobacterales bacterium]|nr:hypothetical protein [Bryobacterales bacterium]
MPKRKARVGEELGTLAIFPVGAFAGLVIPSRHYHITEVLMSLIKLAVYGGIGYWVYQTFFADQPAGGRGGQGGQGGGGSRGSRSSSGRSGASRGGSQSRSGGGQQMSGGGSGAVEATHEGTGFSTQHRVGRGVL